MSFDPRYRALVYVTLVLSFLVVVWGGIVRVTFQMNASSLPHGQIMEAIDLIGSRVAPVLHQGRAPTS